MCFCFPLPYNSGQLFRNGLKKPKREKRNLTISEISEVVKDDISYSISDGMLITTLDFCHRFTLLQTISCGKQYCSLRLDNTCCK